MCMPLCFVLRCDFICCPICKFLIRTFVHTPATIFKYVANTINPLLTFLFKGHMSAAYRRLARYCGSFLSSFFSSGLLSSASNFAMVASAFTFAL